MLTVILFRPIIRIQLGAVMSGLLKLIGLAFAIWLGIFYALEVVATALDPYHNSGGPAIMSAVITAIIAYSWFRKTVRKS